MSILKTALTLLIMLGSLIVTAQNFVLNASGYIGKTKKEIAKIAQSNNSKLYSTEKAGPITSITYFDSLNSMTHQFVFAKKIHFGPRKCFSYFVNMGNRSQYEKTKAGLLAKCEEKVSGKQRAVQVSDQKKYLWHYYGSDTSKLYIFSIEKLHEGRNYR